MTDSRHIFISYARKDGQPFAERLESALQERGHATWRDTRGIDPAKDFTAEIERAIKAADVVVTCITPDTERDDSFVRREIQYALVVGKRVIVARMAEIAPPIHVVNNTWVEFWKDWDKGFEHLLTVLNTPVENYSTPTLPPEATDPFRPYVQSLYERTVDFLDRAVIKLIDLTSEETPEAVNTAPRQPSMIDLFFTAQGMGEEKQAKRPLFNTFAEAFKAYDGRVLLLGEPGAGKTITLMAFARDAAAKRLSDPTAPLPLLGLISSWGEKQSPLSEWLTAGMTEDVKGEIEKGKTLLLLDGLDELGSEQEDQSTKEKYDPRKRFMEQLPVNNQILVTCRAKDYEEIGQKIALKGAVTLRPLDDGQMQSYLAEQPELWAAVQADAGLKEMLTTPLLLSFFAFAYRDDLDGTERAHLANFSNSPGDLRDKIFETYVRKRYEHEERRYVARREAMPFTLEEIYEVLGKVAKTLALKPNYKYVDVNMTHYRWEHIPPVYSFREKDLHVNDQSLLLRFVVNLNIVYSDHNQAYSFNHLLVRDHFAHSSAVMSNDVFALARLGNQNAFSQIIERLMELDHEITEDEMEMFHIVDELGEMGNPFAIIPLLKVDTAIDGDDRPETYKKLKHRTQHAVSKIVNLRTMAAAFRQSDDEELKAYAAYRLAHWRDTPNDLAEEVQNWRKNPNNTELDYWFNDRFRW
ncbi:MAG: TIR domain-containing protein [Anaerolineae bacterium]